MLQFYTDVVGVKLEFTCQFLDCFDSETTTTPEECFVVFSDPSADTYVKSPTGSFGHLAFIDIRDLVLRQVASKVVELPYAILVTVK